MTLQLPARVIRFNKRTNYGRFQRAVQHSFVTLPSLPPRDGQMATLESAIYLHV